MVPPLLPPATRRWVAVEWRSAAVAEHASVASFSAFSLQLMAHGAPPALLRAAHHAALDEVRHAEDSFAIAARYGAEEGPGDLPAHTLPVARDPAALAAATLREGAFAETLAAARAAAAAAAAAVPETRSALLRIAGDEARHAALGWATVAWAAARFPAAAGAVAEAAAAARPAPPLSAAAAAAAGALRAGDAVLAHGVLPEAARSAVDQVVETCALRPLLLALAAGAPLRDATRCGAAAAVGNEALRAAAGAVAQVAHNAADLLQRLDMGDARDDIM